MMALWSQRLRWSQLVGPLMLTASIVLVAGALLYTPGARTGPQQIETPSGPDLIAVVPFRDFGLVPNGSRLQHDFEVTNPSDLAVRLAVGSTSCNCTKAALKDDVIGPGQSTYLNITVDVARSSKTQSVVSEVELIARPISKRAPLQGISDAIAQHKSVTVKARAMEDSGLEPATLSFGVVRRGEGEAKREIVIRLPVNARMSGWSTNAKTKALRLQVQESPGSDANVYRGFVSVDPDKAPPDSTEFRSEILVDYKDPGATGTLVLPVNGTFQDIISAEPDVIVWSSGQYDQTKSVRLHGSADQPISILSVSGDQSLVSWDVHDDGSDSPSLGVRCVAIEPRKKAMRKFQN
jgi:hypothetical protein